MQKQHACERAADSAASRKASRELESRQGGEGSHTLPRATGGDLTDVRRYRHTLK